MEQAVPICADSLRIRLLANVPFDFLFVIKLTVVVKIRSKKEDCV